MTLVVPLVAVASSGPPLAPDAPTARDWLRHELAKAPYHQHQDPISWIIDHVTRFFDRLRDAASGGTTQLWITLAALLAVVVVLIVFVGPVRRRRVAARPPSTLLAENDVSAAELRDRARVLFSTAQWSPALLTAYQAAVRTAIDRILLQPWPGLTAHEAATEIGRQLPQVASRAAFLATTFDTVRYGDAHATEEQAREALDFAESVRNAHEAPLPGTVASIGERP